MLQRDINNYNSVTASERRAGAGIDIEYIMDRYGVNLSAARVLRIIEKLVYASRLNGVKDKRGIPYCYASKEWIAGQIGKSLRTVARAIRDLKAAGVIECKRTRSNAMLFITGYEVYGSLEHEAPTRPQAAPRREAPAERAPSFAPQNDENVISSNAANGTSNITPKSINKSYQSSSIHPSTTQPVRTETLAPSVDDAEKTRMKDELLRQLAAGEPISGEDYGACRTMVRYIVDAVATGQNIKVNGTSLPSSQYWDVVREIKGGSKFSDMLRGIAARDALGEIRNKRAYLLSSAYNHALWSRFGDIRVTEDDISRVKNLPKRERTWKNPALDYQQREYREEDFGEDFFWGTPAWCKKNPELAREYGMDENGNLLEVSVS